MKFENIHSRHLIINQSTVKDILNVFSKIKNTYVFIKINIHLEDQTLHYMLNVVDKTLWVFFQAFRYVINKALFSEH